MYMYKFYLVHCGGTIAYVYKDIRIALELANGSLPSLHLYAFLVLLDNLMCCKLKGVSKNNVTRFSRTQKNSETTKRIN